MNEIKKLRRAIEEMAECLDAEHAWSTKASAWANEAGYIGAGYTEAHWEYDVEEEEEE